MAVATPADRIALLAARHAVVICTGSRAAMPDMPGIAEARVWTNRTAADTSMVPARLAIIGGGPVGVEMATVWQGLGSAVTLLAREPRSVGRVACVDAQGLAALEVAAPHPVVVTRQPPSGSGSSTR